jgi:hypothetical protein
MTIVNDTTDEFKMYQQAALLLFIRKNAQYGNNFQVYGLLGVTCELLGALARLPKLVLWASDHGKSNKESLIDILTDISNYCMMALILISHDNWDGRKDGS